MIGRIESIQLLSQSLLFPPQQDVADKSLIFEPPIYVYLSSYA
jgi:hypothetical protein